MTETEENELKVKVAELCGWTRTEPPIMQPSWRKGSAVVWAEFLPNYPRDLNACAEFEKTIPRDKWDDYCWRLRIAVAGDELRGTKDFEIVCATATQRCQAFVKVMEEKR